MKNRHYFFGSTFLALLIIISVFSAVKQGSAQQAGQIQCNYYHDDIQNTQNEWASECTTPGPYTTDQANQNSTTAIRCADSSQVIKFENSRYNCVALATIPESWVICTEGVFSPVEVHRSQCRNSNEATSCVNTTKYSLAQNSCKAKIQCPGGTTPITDTRCGYLSTSGEKPVCPVDFQNLYLTFGLGGGPQYWDCKSDAPNTTHMTCTAAGGFDYYTNAFQTPGGCASGDSIKTCQSGYSVLGQKCVTSGSSSTQTSQTQTSTTTATYKTCDLSTRELVTCDLATHDKTKTGFSCYKISSALFEKTVLNACKNLKAAAGTPTTPTIPTDTSTVVTPPTQTDDTNIRDRTNETVVSPTDQAVVPAIELPSSAKGLNDYLKEKKGNLLEVARFFNQTTTGKEAKDIQKVVRDNAKDISQIEALLKGAKSESELQNVQKKLEELTKKLDQLEERKTEVVIGQQCQDLEGRIASLEDILGKVKKTGSKNVTADVKQIEETIKSLRADSNQACEAKDEFALVSISPDLDVVEQNLKEKATVVVQSKTDEYVEGTTTALKKLAEEADGAVEGVALCKRVKPMIAKVRSLADELEKAAAKSDTALIGKLVAEAKAAQEILGTGVLRCANEKLESLDELSENPGKAISVTLDDKAIASLKGVPTEAWLDSKMPVLLERITEFTNISKDAPVRGINGLMALDAKSRNKILKSKEKFLTRALEIDALVNDLSNISPETKGKLLQMASDLATGNFCGGVAKKLEKDVDILVNSLKEEKYDEAVLISAYADFKNESSKNQDACYRDKIVKFLDASPDQWYFRYVSKWLEGKAGISRPNENVRLVEILPPVLKALGENVRDQNCKLSQNVAGVPSWGTCWMNKAFELDLKVPTTVSMSDFATREQVADFVNQLVGEQLPVQGVTNDVKLFKDIGICGDKKAAVAMMKANNIMLGGSDKASWGCGKLLTRAELAAIIDRVNSVIFVPTD